MKEIIDRLLASGWNNEACTFYKEINIQSKLLVVNGMKHVSTERRRLEVEYLGPGWISSSDGSRCEQLYSLVFRIYTEQGAIEAEEEFIVRGIEEFTEAAAALSISI